MASALPRVLRLLATVVALVVLAAPVACRSPRGTAPATSQRRTPARNQPQNTRIHVRTLFEQRPWLNLDIAGDRDPEGIHYRVYLDGGSQRGVWRDGTFEVELYDITRTPEGTVQRTLTSSWTMATSDVTTLKSKLLGQGYHIYLRWARKQTAGREIELVTRYRDPDGRAVQGATKRLRVPKYSS